MENIKTLNYNVLIENDIVKIEFKNNIAILLPIILDDFLNIKEIGLINNSPIILYDKNSETSLDVVKNFLNENKVVYIDSNIEFIGSFNLNLKYFNINKNLLHYYIINAKDKEIFKNIKDLNFINISNIIENNDVILYSLFLQYYFITFSDNFLNKNIVM